MASNTFSKVVPLLVEEIHSGHKASIDQNMELAFVLAKAKVLPIEHHSICAKLFWPLAVIHLDQEHIMVFDRLALLEANIFEIETSGCVKILKAIRLKQQSTDEIESYFKVLDDLEKTLVRSFKRIKNTLPGCFNVESLSPKFVDFLYADRDQETEMSEATLDARISSEEIEATAIILRDIWLQLNEDISLFSDILEWLGNEKNPWLGVIVAKINAITANYRVKYDKIAAENKKTILESDLRRREELHTIDIRMSPEISVVEAEVSRLGRKETLRRSEGGGKKREEKSFSDDFRQADIQLWRMKEERKRLMTQVESYHGDIVKRCNARLTDCNAERDREVAPWALDQEEMVAQSPRIVEKLSKLKELCDQCLEEFNSHVLKHEDETSSTTPTSWTAILLPFWVLGVDNESWLRKVNFVLPSVLLSRGSFSTCLRKLFTGEGIPLDSSLNTFKKVLVSNLKQEISQNRLFAEEMLIKAYNHCIFRKPLFKDDLKRGVSQLRKCRYISSKKERQMIIHYHQLG